MLNRTFTPASTSVIADPEILSENQVILNPVILYLSMVSGGTKLKKDDLQMYREILLKEKAQLLETISNKRETVWEIGDLKDIDEVASGLVNRDLKMTLEEKDRMLLEQIEEALDRIGKEIYGNCEMCGEFIGEERLKAIPFARLCISCKSELERSP